MYEISNSDDTINSRDIIERIEDLEDILSDDDGNLPTLSDLASDDSRRVELEELEELRKLAKQAEVSPDWNHGETLIRETYFTDYIMNVVEDCYEMPEALNSGNWPWRHLEMDWEAAAEEAKSDYLEVDFSGVTYLIRA